MCFTDTCVDVTCLLHILDDLILVCQKQILTLIQKTQRILGILIADQIIGNNTIQLKN